MPYELSAMEIGKRQPRIASHYQRYVKQKWLGKKQEKKSFHW